MSEDDSNTFTEIVPTVKVQTMFHYTESDSKIERCQGGALVLGQAEPTLKQLNLKSLAMQADPKNSGCPTPAEPIFESRAVYIQAPSIFMRKTPSLEAEVVSEALFAEEVLLLESSGMWHLIQTPDGYQGWIPQGHVISRSQRYPSDLEVQTLKAHLYRKPETERGPYLSLPFSAKLVLLKEVDSRWLQVQLPDDTCGFIQKGDVTLEPFELIAFSKKFLGLPYTWGGRSSFGFDCSGYTQMLYSRIGIALPRDARQQILLGSPTVQPILGDLLFWGFSETEIRHVGLFLDNGTFIHTSSRENKPYLRISSLSDPEWNGQGAYSFYTTRRFHAVQTSYHKGHPSSHRIDETARLLDRCKSS